MKNIHEIWLRKLFDNGKEYPKAIFAGNNCYIPLKEEKVAKIQFGGIEHKICDVLSVKVISTSCGTIDSVIIPFSSVWDRGEKKTPYIGMETYDDGNWQYGTPDETDMNMLRTKVNQYFHMFTGNAQ